MSTPPVVPCLKIGTNVPPSSTDFLPDISFSDPPQPNTTVDPKLMEAIYEIADYNYNAGVISGARQAIAYLAGYLLERGLPNDIEYVKYDIMLALQCARDEMGV